MENKKPWEIAAEQEEEVSSKKPWEIAAEQEQESEPVKKKVYGAFVPTPLNPTREVSTSQSGSGGLGFPKAIDDLAQKKVVEAPNKKYESGYLGEDKPDEFFADAKTRTTSGEIQLPEQKKRLDSNQKKVLKSFAFDIKEAKRKAVEEPLKPIPLSKEEGFKQIDLLEKRQLAVNSLAKGQQDLATKTSNELTGLQNIINKGQEDINKLSNEGRKQEAEALWNSLQPTIYQFKEKEKELNNRLTKLSYYDKRAKATDEEMIRISEGQQSINNQWDRLNAGLSTLSANILRSPQFAYNTIITAQNKIAREIGLPEAPYQEEGYLSNMAKYFEKNADAYHKVVEKKQKQADYDIVSLFAKGENSKALNLLFENIVESAPTTGAIALGGVAGLTSLGTTIGGGLVFGAGTFEENKAKGVDNATNVVNSWTNGLLEGIFESTGTLSIINDAKNMFAKSGKTAVEESAKNIWQKVYGKAVEKLFPVTSAVKEGISEGETAFTQNLVNIIQGVDEEYNNNYQEIIDSDLDEETKQSQLSEMTRQSLFKGVPDAFLTGVGMGAILGGGAKQGYTAVDEKNRKAVAEAKKKFNEYATTLTNPTVSAEAKELIQQKATEEANKIVEIEEKDDNDLKEKLSKEDYEAVVEIQSKINNLESSIDAIDNEQSKAVVYEQVNELNKEKAEILKREIKPQDEIRNTDNNIRPQVESPQQEINIKPIEVIAGEEQDNADGGVAKVVQGDGQGVENSDVLKQNKIEGKLFTEKESEDYQKEIESKYNNSDTPISKRFGQENEDIRQKAFSYDQPLAQKEVNGIDVRIAEGLVEGEPYSGKRRQTYLLYADGKIAGKFYSVNDAKKVVKFIEDNLVKALPSSQPNLPQEKAVGKNVEVVTPKENEALRDVESYEGMFNPKKTGISGLDALLKDDGYNYFYKSVSGEVVMMSPDEYLKKVREGLKTKEDANVTKDKKDAINEAINEGNKIYMPFISTKDGKFSQEGRNRAVIAKERGEKLIPVFIEKDISFDDKIAKGQEYIKSAIKDGATAKEEVLSKLEKQGLHRDAIRFIDNNFDDKAVESLLSKEQTPAKEESPVFDDKNKTKENEVKPIRQLGTGANVYFETDGYRVNDGKDGKTYLIISDENDKSGFPLTNIEFDNVNEAVFVAKKISEIRPDGLTKEYDIDKIVDGFKEEYKEQTPSGIKEQEVKVNTPDKVQEEVELKGRVFRDNYNRTFEVKGEVAGILTLEDVDTGKILRKKKSEVLSDFKEIIEEEVVDKTKIVTEALPKGGELKGITEVKVSENGEKVSYGTKTNTTSISVKGLSVEQIKAELEEEKKVLAMSKKRAENFNEEELWEQKGMTRQEKEDAIKLHKNSLLSIEKTEKIVIPFYEKHLELLTPKTNINENIEERPLLEKPQTSGNEGEVGQASSKLRTQENAKEEVADGSKSGYNPKFKTANKVLGEETTIEMPNGETREAEYMVVESDDILASHNESSFNDTIGFPKTKDGRNANSRNYKGDKSAQLKVDDNAKNLKPSIVISDTATTDGGVPIISQEGIVVSGNGRTMAIKLSQKIAPEKYQAYKADLLKRAAKFGLDPNEVAKMKNPILVKVDKNIKDYSVKTFDEYNGKFQKEESPIDKAIKRSSIIQNDEKLKDRILSIIGRHETMSDLFDNKADRKELFDFLVANDIILKQETPKYLQENGEFTPDGKDLINDVLIATILSPETLEATSNVKAFRNKIINALPVLTVNYKLGNNSLETEINEAILLQSKIATMGSQEEFWRHLKQLGMFETANPNTVIINRMINNGAINFKKFIVTYNKSMEVDENNLFGGDQVLTKQQVIDNLKQSNLNENEKQVIANLEDLYAANEEKRPSGNDKMVGGNEAKERVTQPTATPETKAAIEVYNKLKENNDTTTRKEYKALPESIKRVLDNIVNINKQLEQNKLITKKGNCP